MLLGLPAEANGLVAGCGQCSSQLEARQTSRTGIPSSWLLLWQSEPTPGRILKGTATAQIQTEWLWSSTVLLIVPISTASMAWHGDTSWAVALVGEVDAPHT